MKLHIFLPAVMVLMSACEQSHTASKKEIEALNLKRGAMITCSPAGGQFGSAEFTITGTGKDQEQFNLGLILLHSFEYDEAEKVFAKIIDESPGCAMAYWGVAMCNYHPLWTAPLPGELEKGFRAVAIANSVSGKNDKETAYINAIAAFFKDAKLLNHRTRTIRFEKGMELVTKQFPGDKEATTLYALALTAAADPTDKTLFKQKKAGALLNNLYASSPQHPGIVHYIIHAYDSPELAAMALTAARKYASVAPASAHALHMPSHIFTRLGLWNEAIGSNLASVESAQCYARAAGIKGHWDEEMHSLDYLMYAYLQKGDNAKAKEYLDYLGGIKEIHPANFKVAYALAAIPSRYLLENHLWQEAANLQVNEANVVWKDFPWQRAMIHFTRLLGAAHSNQISLAKTELQQLEKIRDTLGLLKDDYKSNQVQVQIYTGTAWILLKEGKESEALIQMAAAADLEDKTEKHPVTPAEVVPAGQLLGDMLLILQRPQEAFKTFVASLERQPGRFNSLYGAAQAAQACGDNAIAAKYYQQLIVNAGAGAQLRPELQTAHQFINRSAALAKVQ